MEKELLVLMISSPSRDDLVFPKVSIFLFICNVLKALLRSNSEPRNTFFCDQGGWEDDETMSEAACREAWEEAGVKGVLGVGFSALLGHRHGHLCTVMFNCNRNV